jgi:2-phosphosulfolactate phosphatase
MDFDQSGYTIRCEWGLHGIKALATDCDVLIVVDVLSFCTAVNIAVERGALVYPCVWDMDECADFAQQHNAELARKSGSTFSLSPQTLLSITSGTKLVLPSPNGSTLSLAVDSKPILAGCLRNASAVARVAQQLGDTIGIIAAGERWHSGEHSPLRPSLEDMIGAGAIVRALTGTMSPDAEAMRAVYVQFQDRLLDYLESCGSGVELIRKGLGKDVLLSAELDISQTVPILRNGRYVAFSDV